MSKKKAYHITCDPDVWNMAKHKISEPLSCFIQKQLEIACRLDNKKAEIEKELYEKEQDVIALRSQLCKIQREESLQKINQTNYEECMVSIHRLFEINGLVGENQITHIANQHNVTPNDLIKYVKSQGIKVVDLFEPNKEGKMKSGISLR